MSDEAIGETITKGSLGSQVIEWVPAFFCVLSVVMVVFPEYASAAQDGTLRAEATVIENLLTGNIMRGIAIAGNIWGLVQSYMKSSVMVLSGVLGIDLIGCGMLGWVKTTWALVI